MLITGFPAGMLACNCYVLAQRAGADAVIIDPGQRAMGPLRRILEENRLIPAAVLLTHGHIDHIWSAQKVCDHFGIPAYIHPADRFMLADPIRGFGPRLGQVLAGALFREPKQVVELDLDAAVIDLGGIPVTVDHTPGHTRGSVVFRVHGGGQERSDPGIGTGGQERSDPGIGTGGQERSDPGNGTDGTGGSIGSIGTGGNDVVFSGDTLFRQSVGRTDLPGGSGRDLLGSIMEKLMVLDDDTVVLPGHGDPTTIGVERRTNPFLEGLTL